LAGAFDPTLLLDERLEVLAASTAAEALVGGSPGSLRGLPFAALCAPDSVEVAVRHLAELGPSGRARFEIVLREPKGRGATAEVSAVAVEAGGARGSLLAVRDLTGERTRETWFRLAVEESPDGILLTRLCDGMMVEVNDAFARNLGWSREQMLGRSTLALGIWADPEERRALVERLQRDGVVHGVDVHTRRADGRLSVNSYSARRVVFDGVEHLVSIARDVTAARDLEAEHARLSARFQVQQERLERILELMQEGVWVLDGDGLTLFANARTAEILGTPQRSMVGRSHLDFVPPENVAEAARMRREVMGGKLLRQEFPHRMPDGSTHHLWSSLSPLREADGRITGSIGVLLDVTERRRSEERLAEEKERLAVTLQSIGDAVIATDSLARVTVLNAAATVLTGWTAAEAIGCPLAEVFRIIDEDTGLPVESPATRVLQEGVVVGLANHTALIARDGQVRSIADSGAPIRAADGSTLGVVLVFRDQTEERLAQRAMREAEERLAGSERRYRLLADNALDVIWRLDLATLRFLYVSPSVLKLSGYTPDETIAMPLFEVLAPESVATVQALLASIGTAREPDFHTTIVCQRCKDGSTKQVEISATLVRDPAGQAIEVVGMSRDATARLAAEDALRESEQRFRALIEKSTDIIMVFDAEKRIRFWSPSATQCLGWRAEEVLGRRLYDLGMIHPEDQAALLEATRSIATRARDTAQVQARHRHRDGSWRLIEGTGRNLLDDPAVRGVVVNARDVTDQRRLEEQLRQTQKLESIGRLAGGVAHDFNNILTVVLSCADSLQHELAGRLPAALADVEQIQTSGWRARDLTRHLLAFARKQVIAPVRLDLNEVVRTGEKLLRRVLGEDIALVLELERAPWPVLCDPSQVDQALMNLVVNARDAMPGGGTLTLGTRNLPAKGGGAEAEARDQVILFVRDTGVGMSSHVRAHLFEPFFTTKEQGKGTGLGLSTVYGIVTQGGGTVGVESEPGHGSTIELRFPRASAASVQVREEPAPAPCARAGTELLLVVEDDPYVRAVTVRTLGEAGYRLLVAASGQEALALLGLQSSPLDLAVTDVVMPGMSGRALVEELRRRQPSLRALYLSGYSGDALARHGVLDEGIEFLPKPFTPDALLARVRAVLDAR
jgi:PAS domain S-box-containing protein